jgi:predicted nucleotidyltransferase
MRWLSGRKVEGRATVEHTRPATWEDLKKIARYLEESGAQYALVGAYALAAHGYPRFSEDIDLLVNPTAQNSIRWIAALSRLPDQAAQVLSSEPDVFGQDSLHALRINDEITVDVMPSVAGLTWQELEPHILSIDIGCFSLYGNGITTMSHGRN